VLDPGDEHPPVPHVPPPPPAPPPEPLPARSEPVRDDLKLIKGIGPVLERRLHELGVKSFADLAALTPERVKEIDEAIEFPGRIERERWIEQAKELLARRPN
jgi:predicted flap endonuclease-1-like 5' DNA nuclease